MLVRGKFHINNQIDHNGSTEGVIVQQIRTRHPCEWNTPQYQMIDSSVLMRMQANEPLF
jgi:hypothetical protein